MTSPIPPPDPSQPETRLRVGVPCGPDCVHARRLPPPHFDWVLCTSPQVGGPHRIDRGHCRFFRPYSGTAGEK